MPIQLYIAPYESGTLNGRTVNASRCLWTLRSASIPVGGAGAQIVTLESGGAKSWCLTAVDGSTLAHTALGADSQIDSLPPLLDAALSTLPAPARNTLTTRLGALRVPDDDLTLSSSIRDVARLVGRVLLLASDDPGGYPEGDLDGTFGALTAPRRAAFVSWANRRGVDVSDVGNGTLLRIVVRRLMTRYPWPGTIRLGATEL